MIQLVIFFLTCLYISQANVPDKECYSITNGLSTTSNINRVRFYRRIYEGCTKIVGPLEITHLNLKNNETLDFLDSIRSITDYLLIYHVVAKELRLSNLSVIGGKKLFMGNSLMIVDSRIEDFDIHSLIEVSRGSVLISKVEGFQSISGITFYEFIVDSSNQKISTDFSFKRIQCPATCPTHLHRLRCWSETQCQTLTRANCHTKCPNQCLLKGKTAVCMKSESTKIHKNIDKIPIEADFNEKSTISCPRGEVPFRDVCVRLNPGTQSYICTTYKDEYIIEMTDSNIHQLKDCVIIEGSLIYYPGGKDLRMSDLETLKSIQAVTGFIYITVPVDVQSLDFLGNVIYVGGDLLHMGYSIIIFDVHKSSLRCLGWSKLEVASGKMFFYTPIIMCDQYDYIHKLSIAKKYGFNFYCMSTVKPEMVELKSPYF